MTDQHELSQQEIYNAQLAKYSLTSLKDIIQKENSLPIVPLFLERVQKNLISADHRFVVFQWMFELGQDYNLSLSTLQKSFCYVDVMLSSLQFPPDALYLIGLSALILSAKMDENQDHYFHFHQGVLHQLPEIKIFENTGISSAQIIKCENAILQFLKWRSLVPTPTETLKLLLYYTNHTQDFSKMIEKSNEYIMTCQITYEMSIYSSSSIALASLLTVLEEWGFHNFSEGVINLIIENGIPFDFDSTQQCKRHLQSLILHESPSQQGQTIQIIESDHHQSHETVDSENSFQNLRDSQCQFDHDASGSPCLESCEALNFGDIELEDVSEQQEPEESSENEEECESQISFQQDSQFTDETQDTLQQKSFKTKIILKRKSSSAQLLKKRKNSFKKKSLRTRGPEQLLSFELKDTCGEQQHIEKHQSIRNVQLSNLYESIDNEQWDEELYINV